MRPRARDLCCQGGLYTMEGNKFGGSPNGGVAGDGENEKREKIVGEHIRYRVKDGEKKGERERDEKTELEWKLHVVF